MAQIHYNTTSYNTIHYATMQYNTTYKMDYNVVLHSNSMVLPSLFGSLQPNSEATASNSGHGPSSRIWQYQKGAGSLDSTHPPKWASDCKCFHMGVWDAGSLPRLGPDSAYASRAGFWKQQDCVLAGRKKDRF